MATLIDVLDALYSALQTVLSNNTSVTDTGRHVDVLDRTEDIVYPFLGFEWNRQPYDYGLSGNQLIKNVTKNGSDIEVTRANVYELTIDVGAVVDRDAPRQRDELLIATDRELSQYVRSPTDFQSDVFYFDDAGTTPSDIGDAEDAGVRSTYVLRYCRFDTDTVPAADTVSLDVDTEGVDTYPEKY